jgi:adenosine deaminase
VDLNHRPSGYEPDELPDCSTPRQEQTIYDASGFIPAASLGPRCLSPAAHGAWHERGEAARMSLAERIPKLHLHCHLEGTLRPETFVELASEHGVPLRYRPDGGQGEAHASGRSERVDASDPYRFGGFEDFLLTFAAANRAMQRPGDYARLAREFVEDALAQNVVYGELFVSPSVWTFFNRNLDVRECMGAIWSELRAAAPRAHFALIVDLTRNFGTERAMQTARLAASLTDCGVIGVGLGGDEARFPAELFVRPFEFARAQGLHRVAHAGEAAGAFSVRAAVERLGAQRIGHGISALDDPGVVELLAVNGIPVEICPTSNRLTGAALPDAHAYVEFDSAGCIVVIDADDPAMFGTSIEREYALVEETAGSAALLRYVRNAIEASFAGDATKATLRDKLKEYL